MRRLEKRRSVAVGVLSKVVARQAIHTLRGSQYTILGTAQCENVSVVAKPEGHDGVRWQRWYDWWDRWSSALIQDERVVHRNLPRRRIKNRRLHEGRLIHIRFVAIAGSRIGRHQLVWSRESRRRKCVRWNDDRAVRIRSGSVLSVHINETQHVYEKANCYPNPAFHDTLLCRHIRHTPARD